MEKVYTRMHYIEEFCSQLVECHENYVFAIAVYIDCRGNIFDRVVSSQQPGFLMTYVEPPTFIYKSLFLKNVDLGDSLMSNATYKKWITIIKAYKKYTQECAR
jgi:hypothetical protein